MGVIENTERFSFFFFFYADRRGRTISKREARGSEGTRKKREERGGE